MSGVAKDDTRKQPLVDFAGQRRNIPGIADIGHINSPSSERQARLKLERAIRRIGTGRYGARLVHDHAAADDRQPGTRSTRTRPKVPRRRHRVDWAAAGRPERRPGPARCATSRPAGIAANSRSIRSSKATAAALPPLPTSRKGTTEPCSSSAACSDTGARQRPRFDVTAAHGDRAVIYILS